MANSLLVQLGFKTDKSSVSSAVSGVNEITSAIKGLKKAANLLVVGQGLREFSAGIKSIASSARNMVSSGFNFAEEFAKVGDSIAKTSRIVGLSVKDYQAFGSAARHAGMSTEEMDTALKKFNVNLAKARAGDKNSFKMFDSILGGRKLSEFKDNASVIAAIADGYTKLGSAEQKAFVSQELFGRSGLKMSELLSGGSGEINKLLADFEARGGGFSEEGAKRAEEFNDELQNVKETIGSLKISVAQELFPTFIDFFKTVQDFVKENRESLIPVVNEVFGKTATLVKSLLPYIPKVLNSILSVVNAIGPGTIAIVAGVASILPAVGHILFGLYQILPIIKVIGSVLSVKVLGVIGLIALGVASWVLAIKSANGECKWWSDFVRNDLKNSFGVVGKAIDWVADVFASWLYNIYHAVDAWKGWSNFVRNDLKCILGFTDMIGDAVANVLFGIYKIFSPLVDIIEKVLPKIPVIGKLFGSDLKFENVAGDLTAGMNDNSTLGSAVGQTVSESRTTTTSRFSVDFKNMPKGVQVTPPDKGDFDWSRGYVLGGV